MIHQFTKIVVFQLQEHPQIFLFKEQGKKFSHAYAVNLPVFLFSSAHGIQLATALITQHTSRES